MFKGNKKYIFTLAICFTILILIQVLTPKPIEWRPSYMQKDKIPFGTSALYEMLPRIFPGQTIENKSRPIYNNLSEEKKINSNYIFINSSFQPDKLDSKFLLDYVKEGNCAFIAANYFGGKLADTLKLKTDNYLGMGNLVDSNAIASMLHPYDTAEINFTNPQLKRKQPYIFSKASENVYFTSFDTANTTVLGNNKNGNVNFISVKWGKGKLFLSSVPEVFANYLFIDTKNYDYAYKALSYLPNRETIWDEYYKDGNVRNENPIGIIFKNPPLQAAYYLCLGSILLFMIIGIKRKQRIIPVSEPLRNSTLDFVDIVGTLYYQAGNHKNISDKKINYFLEYIRSAFQVKTNIFDDTLIERISNLSGIEREKIKTLFYYFADLQVKTVISERELQKLNGMIEDFYMENKR